MERISTCDLREKEVINLCNGARLGCPNDFEFQSCDGRITALVITHGGGFLGLGREREMVIPWNRIECIGEDTILVKLSGEECCLSDRSRKGRIFHL